MIDLTDDERVQLEALLNIARSVLANSSGHLCSQLVSGQLDPRQRAAVEAEIERADELTAAARSLLRKLKVSEAVQ